MINVKGKNMPKKEKKVAMDVRRKGSSPNGLIKSLMRKGLGCGKILDFTVRFVMMHKARIKKAQILIAQPNPT
jgi:hypothetical protein